MELLTYTQEWDTSEAWLGDGWIADEPPPKKMFGSMSRGLFLRGGKVLLSMCPLTEAWILDDLVLSGRRDVGVIDDLTILDNEELYRGEIDLLRNMGLNEQQFSQYFDLLLYKDKEKGQFVEDKGKKARVFIESIVPAEMVDKTSELKLMRFVQDTEPDEAPSRFGGKFRSLVGRVLKQFDKSKHWITPFEIPTDWPMIVMIDFHLRKPHAISYHCVNRQGVKFINKERWEHLSPEETADVIIRDKTAHAWNIQDVYIDPLSKGDTSYMRNRMGDDLQDSFSIIADRLEDHGIELHVASKDKDSGIRNIWDDLQGPNGMPTYFVFDTCERHLYEIQRWVYDEDGKPAKEHDDMMENWYRATLVDLDYLAPPKPALAGNRGYAHASESWLGV